MNAIKLMWYEFISQMLPELAGLQRVKTVNNQEDAWFSSVSFVDLFYDEDIVNGLCYLVLEGYSPIRFFTNIPTVYDEQNIPLDWYSIACIEFTMMGEGNRTSIQIEVTVRTTRKLKKRDKKQLAFRKAFRLWEPFSKIQFKNVRYLFKFEIGA